MQLDGGQKDSRGSNNPPEMASGWWIVPFCGLGALMWYQIRLIAVGLFF